jgi:hypothetical protein
MQNVELTPKAPDPALVRRVCRQMGGPLVPLHDKISRTQGPARASISPLRR